MRISYINGLCIAVNDENCLSLVEFKMKDEEKLYLIVNVFEIAKR